MALAHVSLDDKYGLESGRVYLTGTQALVRLALAQRDRDRAAGLKTAGFISGYRGSPLGGYDQALWKARRHLLGHDIHFQPGVNEDLAATAVWGSQQVNLWPGGTVDGVFGIWYGKGPGVDRSGDVFKHANGAGTAPHGGVLALAGDDHASKSSTFPHQSEHAFAAAMIPVLHPSGVQEIIDLGLHGFAMSRYSGCWVGFKCLTETIDSSASIRVAPDRVGIAVPEDFDMPPGGLGIRWPDPPLVVEERLMRHKLYAALAYARTNALDYVARGSVDRKRRRFGIVTVGKSYLDVLQALDLLGLDEETERALGIAVYKVAMPWPLEPDGVRVFCDGLEEVVVVEEKRALIENQLKEQLYNAPLTRRPVIVGKFDDRRDWLLPSNGELWPGQVAIAIGRRLVERFGGDGPLARVAERLRFLEDREARKVVKHPKAIDRVPYYCSGCPHNTSTRVPDGSRALGGIGCHYMATWMPDRPTETFSQMGGEGVAWIGQAPFTETAHVFTNLGDGTYFHSGLLAIRAALAAGVNITYKILYNDAVAMTGGQPVDGQLTPAMIAAQLRAEGVERMVMVTDRPETYGGPGPRGIGLPEGMPVAHRDDLDRIQRDLRETPGVSVIVYDQTCAAEKRRRRKRKQFPDPPRRVVINDAVCEGCGDCSKQSNCLSVTPLETEFGRKRAIDQSSCNKDFSCLKGFCPSFVTVEGGALRKPDAQASTATAFPALPEPALPALDRPFNILITGIGGTGVVTIGALLGMAVHLEGKGVSVLDQMGLAQKGGAVMTHVRIASRPEEIAAVRVAAGSADLVLGCDLVVAAGTAAVSTMAPGRTTAVINRTEAPTAGFTQNPDFQFPGGAMVEIVADGVGGKDAVHAVAATRLATRLLGDSIATNLFMLGYAWQRGRVPVGRDAIERAITLNGVAVEANEQAFLWGRRAAFDLAAVEAVAKPAAETPDRLTLSQTLPALIDRRVRHLTGYQDAAYAARYKALVDTVWAAEAAIGVEPGLETLTGTVARYAAKLMAYKDEYEVARLYTETGFLDQVRQQFSGDFKLTFHLAPPVLADRDPETGHLKKQTFGPWMLRAFKLLAKFKGLRGTRFDPFGWTAERRTERRLIADYVATVERLIADLTPANHGLAVEIARVPEFIRGFGHVKEAHLERAEATRTDLLAQWQAYTTRDEAPRLAAE